MYQILKMRLPTKEEWNLLVSITGGDDRIIHCEGVYSWAQDASTTRAIDRIVFGLYSGFTWSCHPSDSCDTIIGFRPVFEVPNSNDAPGEVIAIGTLYMNGCPIKIPGAKENICAYIPGASVELREALDDPNYQLRAIKVGKVYIADRVVLNQISWDDSQGICMLTPEIKSVRLPTTAEWDRLVDIAEKTRTNIHFEDMFSWCETSPNSHDMMAMWEIRGGISPRGKDYAYAASRRPNVGFRPVFELANPNILADGAVAMAGTLYAGGLPVKVPESLADIPDYVPQDNLEFRESLGDRAYQIQGIKVGHVLIADRVLLKNISWHSAKKAYVCKPGQDPCTWAVPIEAFVTVEANSVGEALAIAARKADHVGASLRCQTPEEYLSYLKK